MDKNEIAHNFHVVFSIFITIQQMWIENGIMWVKAAEGTTIRRETTRYLQHYHKIITTI